MKKIVGILAAAALIATSVFAADVSAKVRIDGTVFEYDGAALEYKADDAKFEPTGSFKLLRASSQARPYWSPYITLSASTDNAGGQVLFIEEEDGKGNVKIDRPNVWFKPLDMLKITAGFQEYMMNQETIDYTSISKADQDFGYAVSYAQDAISVNVFLGTGNNGWFFKDAIANCGTSKEPAGSYLKDLYVNGAYTADFGTISAMFEFKSKGGDFKPTEVGKYDEDVYGNTGTTATPAYGIVHAKGSTKVTEGKYTSYNSQLIKFGAGYKNTIDDLTFWADVVATSRAALSDKEWAVASAVEKKSGETQIDWARRVGIDRNKEKKSNDIFGLAVDGFVQYNMDALTLKGYVKADIFNFNHGYENKDGKWTDSIFADNNFALGLKARADYKLDNGLNLYAVFASDNLLRKEIKSDATADNWDYASSVFVSTIKLGANGDVGIVSWETSLNFDTGVNVTGATDEKKNNKWDKVKVSMPIYFQVAF